jgi:hypothetical protein
MPPSHPARATLLPEEHCYPLALETRCDDVGRRISVQVADRDVVGAWPGAEGRLTSSRKRRRLAAR